MFVIFIIRTIILKQISMRRIVKRYKLINTKTEQVIGEASTLEGVSKLIGCSRRQIHNTINNNNVFTYKKIEYTII